MREGEGEREVGEGFEIGGRHTCHCLAVVFRILWMIIIFYVSVFCLNSIRDLG